MFLLSYWIHCDSIDNNHSNTLIRHLLPPCNSQNPTALSVSLNLWGELAAKSSMLSEVLLFLFWLLSNVRMSNPIESMLKSWLWQSPVLFLWSWHNRWEDSNEVNGALRKCCVPSAQDKVLFWGESSNFIRYNSFLCLRVEILVCVKWTIVFAWLACWISDQKKNRSYGRCQLFLVGLCVEIHTTSRLGQSIQIQPEQLCRHLREHLGSDPRRQKSK